MNYDLDHRVVVVVGQQRHDGRQKEEGRESIVSNYGSTNEIKGSANSRATVTHLRRRDDIPRVGRC